jgi:hypothetical protein
VIDRLHADAQALQAQHAAASGVPALAAVRRQLLAFQRGFLRAETTLDFFGDAISTRSNPEVSALLRACDTLAHRSMSALLDTIGRPTPVALTYLDKGRGASILKAGLRLWDGGQTCPVAVIKITRHNLLRPTALVHEAGHQVAHITGWNAELASALATALDHEGGASTAVAQAWAGWASEIAADCFAFASTGFASVAALHDVLATEASSAFRYLPGDPHPLSHLRVLLGAQLCRHAWGAGPWDTLDRAWRALHPDRLATDRVRRLVRASVPLLPLVARVCLDQPLPCFGGRALRALLLLERVSPTALHALGTQLGPALYTSPHWLWSEPLRLLGLTGLDLVERPQDLPPILELQRQSMLRLGASSTT